MAKSKNPAELVIFGNPRRSRVRSRRNADKWTEYLSSSDKSKAQAEAKILRDKGNTVKVQPRGGKWAVLVKPTPGFNPGRSVVYRVQLDTGGVSKTLRSKKAAEKYLRWLESTGKRGTIVRLNPSKPEELTQAVELYETFQGKRAENIIEAQRSAAMRTDYAALGPLLAIGLYTPDLKIPSPDHWEDYPHLKFGKDVMLASNAGASQLYAIGGDQDVSKVAVQIPDVDTSKDLLDLGPIAFVVYFARKSADNFQPTEYMHQFDTPRPSLGFDQVKREIFFAGGRYTIEERGIDH